MTGRDNRNNRTDKKEGTDNMCVPKRLAALRQKMKENGINAYLVPTDDFHGSEYVGDYFKCRRFLTGFTGSAGTALVAMDGAWLWTDGRYFLQAQGELKDSTVTLMKAGEEGVPTIERFVQEHLKEGEVLGFDGRCMTAGKGDRFERILKKNGAGVMVSRNGSPLDLAGEIWEDRPALSCEKVWSLDISYAGKTRAEKLKELRAAMEEKKCGYHVLTSIDDIAWLLNLRGSDIACNPVFLSYLVVTPDNVLLFAQAEAFDEEILRALEADGVILKAYNDIYSYVKDIPEKSRVLLDSSIVNYTLWTSLTHVTRVDSPNPTMLLKAVKNKAEMEHMREAHIKDGVAVTRFMYWLKKRMASYDPKVPETELSTAEKLLELRKEQEHFLDLSFETIAAYGPHGAVIHYSPTPETDIPLEAKSFLLVDSGGQYLEGTTDITRTFACGPLTDEEKEYYTRVLRGNLNLAAARFKYGATGMTFDYLARSPLWEAGKDYNHGTGHGVGFLLNVHEAPNSFSYKPMQGRRTPCVFEEGMITSDEPGFYLEGRFGVRCENLLLCVEAEKNEYGRFMRFETLTMVPWDLDAVDPDQLSAGEKKLLNEYHAQVWEKISPYLEGDEKEWLKEATRAI